MLNNNLKTKLVSYTLLLILLIAGSFLTFYVYQMSNLVEDQLIEVGFHLSDELAFSSSAGVVNNRPAQIQPALQNALKEEEVKMAAVYDKQGSAIISSQISSQKEDIEVE